MFIKYVSKKKINYEEIKRFLDVANEKNQMSNNGPTKRLLEKKLEQLLELNKDKCVICTSSGTSALHTVMYHCEKELEYNWTSPEFTFPSIAVGKMFKVEIKEVNVEGSLDVDSCLLKYDGIIITNLFGSYVDLEAWQTFCVKNNKVLIYDNASSPLSKFNDKNICNYGDYCIGSLHHTKYLGYGEGGFIVAKKTEYEELNSITNFGFYLTRVPKKHSSNFKMSDVAAAFILNNVYNYDVDKHVANQKIIIDELKSEKNLEMFNYKEGVVYGNLPILFKQEQDSMIFKDLGIEAQKYYYPLKGGPNAENLYKRIVNFPLHAYLSDYEIEYMIQQIRSKNE